jgi:hypothetical protein
MWPRDFVLRRGRVMCNDRCGLARFRRVRSLARAAFGCDTPAHFERNIVVERTGMRLLVRHAELGQEIEDHVWLDLELASQLVDSDFTHTMMPQAAKNTVLLGF